MVNVEHIRADFPILGREVNGWPLVYLDSAATAQKPVQVLDAIIDYYKTCNSNVHRGAHALGDEATERYEQARATVAHFINARHSHEVVFLRNTTEGVNLVARGWALNHLNPGDEIVVSGYEHHSNFLPWQQACAERGATFRILELNDEQQISTDALNVIGPRTKLVAIGHASNAFGTIAPLAEIVAAAHRYGAKIFVDGAQSVPHLKTDVQALDIDFLAFSGHKLGGPMGIGVLWAREELLLETSPLLLGGGMVNTVSVDEVTYQPYAERFEAGTPNVADACGLAAAVEYLSAIGLDAIRQHEKDLVSHAYKALRTVPGVRLYGPENVEEHSGVISFTLNGVAVTDIAGFLDKEGIAIRGGKHCCHPAMTALGIEGTARASVYLYNSIDEIDRLADAIDRLRVRGFRSAALAGRFCP